MANNNADGTLILDTELDNSGFEKGSAKLLSAIDGLSTQIEKFGAAMEKAFSNCDFGCVHAKIAKAFALIAAALVQLTTPAALSVFLTFRCCGAFRYSWYTL